MVEIRTKEWNIAMVKCIMTGSKVFRNHHAKVEYSVMVARSISEITELRIARTPENAIYYALHTLLSQTQYELRPVINSGLSSPVSRLARHLPELKHGRPLPTQIAVYVPRPDHVNVDIVEGLMDCVTPDPQDRKGQPGKIGFGALAVDVRNFSVSNLTLDSVATSLRAGNLQNLQNNLPILKVFEECHKYLNEAKASAKQNMSYDETPPAHPHSVDFVVWTEMQRALGKLETAYVGIIASGIVDKDVTNTILREGQIKIDSFGINGSWVPPFEALLHGLSQGIEQMPADNPATKTLKTAVAAANRNFETAKLFKPVAAPVAETLLISSIDPAIIQPSASTGVEAMRSFLTIPISGKDKQYIKN